MSEPREERKLLIYGSLRQGQRNEGLLRGAVLSRAPARVRGRLYHQLRKSYPALTPGDGFVRGELLVLRDFAARIDALDELETYYGPGDGRNEYERATVEVFPDGGEPEEAYVYLYARDDLGGARNPAVEVPGGDWVEYLKKRER